VFGEVTVARKLKAAPKSAPVVELTATGEPTVEPTTLTEVDSQLECNAVPSRIPEEPDRFEVAIGGNPIHAICSEAEFGSGVHCRYKTSPDGTELKSSTQASFADGPPCIANNVVMLKPHVWSRLCPAVSS
jgi:hypothetical protein